MALVCAHVAIYDVIGERPQRRRAASGGDGGGATAADAVSRTQPIDSVPVAKLKQTTLENTLEKVAISFLARRLNCDI